MRKKLEDLLIYHASRDKSLYLLVNDLGSFEKYRSSFPNRFINCGIGEPNMVSIAAGLALEGNRPVIYSVAGFCIHRGFEQLKFDISYHANKLTIVNAGAGLCYNKVGAGHYLVDDLALMQILPRVDLYAPADIPEFERNFNKALYTDNLSYIRTGLDGCENLLKDGESKREYLKFNNHKVTLVTTGIFTSVAKRICQELPINIFHMNPLKKTIFKEKIIILEDHIEFGGLRSYIQGDILGHIHLPSKVSEIGETRNDVLIKYGLNDESLKKRIKEYL